jgi:acid phosphatase (class A)
MFPLCEKTNRTPMKPIQPRSLHPLHPLAPFLAIALAVATAFVGAAAAPIAAASGPPAHAPIIPRLSAETPETFRFIYLATPAAHIIAPLPPPPADDSPAGRADLETLLQIQQDRTPAQVARARAGAKIDPLLIGKWAFGDAFNKQNLPRARAFLRQANLERHEISSYAKEQFMRVRPYHRGVGIAICLDRQPSGSSYPSGHSTCAATWAALYAAALPEYAALFDDGRREVMWSRVLAGVHYPSDTQAGSLLGARIAAEMLKTPATQAAIADMRAEVLAFLDATPAARRHAEKLLTQKRKK